jgi:hypothetical protein
MMCSTLWLLGRLLHGGTRTGEDTQLPAVAQGGRCS